MLRRGGITIGAGLDPISARVNQLRQGIMAHNSRGRTRRRLTAEAPAAEEHIHREVKRPTRVLILRDCHQRSGVQCSFATATLTDGQPRLLVESFR
jgi:hypothetical protein